MPRSARSSSRCTDSPGSRAAQPERERHRRSLERLGAETIGDELRLRGVGAVENDDELVAAEADDRFLAAGVAHEKTRHPPEHLVAFLWPRSVVVDLEMIDVDEDAAARELRVARRSAARAPSRYRRLSAPVSAIVRAHVAQLRLELACAT